MLNPILKKGLKLVEDENMSFRAAELRLGISTGELSRIGRAMGVKSKDPRGRKVKPVADRIDELASQIKVLKKRKGRGKG